MQCEGFVPGCINVAIHSVNGYNFCTRCAQDYCGYTPGLTPRARAIQLFTESAIPLDPKARDILTEMVAEAITAAMQDAYNNASAHLHAAMYDVENVKIADAVHPETPLTLCLCTDDVRRLADEIRRISNA